MQLNQATDYAFRLVLHLAGMPAGEIVNGQTISEQQNIPPRFLLKIVRFLTQAGLVKSYRGVDGGFALARDPDKITLADVIIAMEGPINIHRCLADNDSCSKHCTEACPVHAALGRAQSELEAVLRKVDFAHLAGKTKIGGEKT